MRSEQLRCPLAAAAALIVAGCAAEPVGAPPPAAEAWLEVSSLGAEPGARIAVAVHVAHRSLTGVQGSLRFDPAALRYAGQPADPARLVIVNDATPGTVRFVALEPDGAALPERVVVVAFEVTGAGAAGTLRLHLELAATLSLAEVHGFRIGRTMEAADVSADGARRLDIGDWHRLLEPRAALQESGPQAVPGQYVAGLRYGDATLNGTINILDAANTANLAVGNQPLLTDASKDYVIAANVHPANAPGLGEDGDPLPPGQNADGSFTINVLDAAVISNEGVGNDQPVAGEPIPGREPRPTARVVLSGVLSADRTLYRDTIYELQGLVIVQGAVTLTIQAGTTIEGDEATRGALAIYRGGHIFARGTRLQPIVFTCDAAIKTRGCWGGLVINGFSLINNGEILPGGVDVNGCPQKVYPTTPGYAGGCLVQDTSGMLRYVRVEYGGMAPAGQGPVPGLSLLGVGSGTVIESVQVHSALDHGLFVGGGTVDVRGIVLTDNAADGLRWEDGWVGRGQFIAIQQSADNDHAIHGINWPTSPDAGPRSNPMLWNVSVSGPPPGQGAGGSALLFEHGSAGTLRNLVVLRAGTSALDIDGLSSCERALGMPPALEVNAAIFFANPEHFSSDTDCLDESAYALNPARANRVIDPLLIAAFNTLTPDWRPAPGSPAASGFMLPPADGFFDLSATYLGAVAPANGTGSSNPWYAGWTRGW